MNLNDQIKDLMQCADGSRLGERDFLPPKEADILSEDVKAKLREQWNASGRDGARVYAKLDEANGSSFYLTGWDGSGCYAGFESNRGFGYVPKTRLSEAKLDEKWDSTATLGHVRHSLVEMEQDELSRLLDTLRRAVTKRTKGRRKNEVKNFIKRFEKMIAQTADDKAEPVSESSAEDKAKHSERRSAFFRNRGLNTPRALRRGWVVKPYDRDDVPGLKPLPTKKETRREVDAALADRKADKAVSESEKNEVAAKMRQVQTKPAFERTPMKSKNPGKTKLPAFLQGRFKYEQRD